MSLAKPADPNLKNDHTLHSGAPLQVQPPSPLTAAVADSQANPEHPTDKQERVDPSPPSIASQELDSQGAQKIS